MIQKQIWIFGDLRTQRYWRASCKVLAKSMALAREVDAQIAMVLLGARRTQADGPVSDHIDPAACVSMAEAAQRSLALGVHTVYCLEHPELGSPVPMSMRLCWRNLPGNINPGLLPLP